MAGGDIDLEASGDKAGTIINKGSDIISQNGDIKIMADQLVEQDWVSADRRDAGVEHENA